MSTSVITLSQKHYIGGGRFRKPFGGPVQFSGARMALAAITYYNSQFNVEDGSSLTITYPQFTAADTYTTQTVSVPLASGFYTFDELDNAIQAACLQNKLYMYDPTSNENVFFLRLVANAITYRCEVNAFFVPTAAMVSAFGWTIPSGSPLQNPSGGVKMVSLSLGFNGTDVCKVVGAPSIPYTYPAALYTSTAATYPSSPFVGSLSGVPEVNKYTAYQMVSSMAINRLSSQHGVMAQVPIQAGFGSQGSFVPPELLYVDVADGSQTFIEVYFLDQDDSMLQNLLDTKFCITIYMHLNN